MKMARKTTALTKGHTLNKLEMAQRLDGTLSRTLVAIRPGVTGAKVLDTLSAAYSWVRFDKPLRFVVKSLTQPGTVAHDGIWYSRVVHDATYEQIMRTPGMFSHTSSAFVGHKASQDFEVKVTLNNNKQSLFTERHSWLILVHVGPPTDKAEIWIDYTATFGGLGGDSSYNSPFEVVDGRFEGPDGDPMDDLPSSGASTTYEFRPPLTQKQAAAFTKRMPANPVYVTRGDLNPVVNDKATVAEIGFAKPQVTMKDVFADELKQTTVTLMKEGGKILRKKLPSLFGKWKGIKRLQPRSPSKLTKSDADDFSSYNGYVTVSPMLSSQSLRATSSIPPLFLSEDTGEPVGATRGLLSGLTDMLPAITGIIADITATLASQNVIVHKSEHALQFLAQDSLFALDDGTDESSPLPEEPQWPEDPSAPGNTVDHLGARMALCGYVCDDNGTPVIHWLSGRPFTEDVPYFTCPKPLWYSDSKMPWDSEVKRKLATNVQISELLNQSFLMLEGYVWGDDSCIHFHSKIPGTRYLGTVAYFAGISMSRSLLYIDDYTQFNTADEVVLIGQNKMKYRNPDEGRTTMFYLYLGAVSDENVARAFLGNWTVDSSVKRLFNVAYIKDQGETPKKLVEPSIDFRYSARSLQLTPDVNIDPASPTYHTLTFDGTRLDPIKIESGPIRMLFGGRWDEQNGWWQSVPYNLATETDISARWGINFKLNAEGFESEVPSTMLYTISPPTRLATGAYLCVEMFTTYGDRLNLELRPKPTIYSVMTGPITRLRYVVEEPSEVIIYAGRETSRPCLAVEGHDGDMYFTGVITAWLVKDKEAAQHWAAIKKDSLLTTGTNLYHYNIRKQGTDFVLTSDHAATGVSSLTSTTQLYDQAGWSSGGIPRAHFRDYRTTPNMCLADLGITGNPDEIELRESEPRVGEDSDARTQHQPACRAECASHS